VCPPRRRFLAPSIGSVISIGRHTYAHSEMLTMREVTSRKILYLLERSHLRNKVGPRISSFSLYYDWNSEVQCCTKQKRMTATVFPPVTASCHPALNLGGKLGGKSRVCGCISLNMRESWSCATLNMSYPQVKGHQVPGSSPVTHVTISAIRLRSVRLPLKFCHMDSRIMGSSP
jgi:hypothetical protein